MGMNHRIHIGFNFHVNFCHADRGDSNDNSGFGRDLARIRDILEILGKANNEGQPVRAAWDFESEYTLGRILPSLGPDVIDGVKARLRERGDELMFSGNHADIFAAMTGEELRTAFNGANTVLGEASDTLCTSHNIFSSTEIGLLKKAGIKAVVLGNSNIGPDALSAVAPELRKSASVQFNPTTYRHGNDSITVIPSYSPADLVDAGALTNLLKTLREMQLQGAVESDLFLLISDDARSVFWESLGVHNLFTPVTGTEGLAGFIKELRKLDYVAYNTPAGYLKDHEAVSEFSFAGDVSGDGDLSPLGELPYERLLHTRIERARIYSKTYAGDKSSETLSKRVKLLSAVNFSGVSPVPARERFDAADKLSLEIQSAERKTVNEKEMSMRTSGRQRLNNSAIGKHVYSRRKDDEERNTFIIMNTSGQKTVTFQLSIESGQCPGIGTLVFECDECQIDSYTAIPMDYDGHFVVSVFVIMRFVDVQNTYKIYYHFDRSDLPKEVHKPLIEVKPEDIPVFHAEGAMKRLLEAQGKLKKPEEPKSDENKAVADRIAAMNDAATAGRAAVTNAVTEKESYVIESRSKNLRIVITGCGATKGKIREVYYKDEKIGDDQFLLSYLKTDGIVKEFEPKKIEDIEIAGKGEGVRITGEVCDGLGSTPGTYSLMFIDTPALKGADGILVYLDVKYPEPSGLGSRKYEVAAPFQITPLYRAGVSVIRKDFAGNISDYPVSGITKTVRENSNLNSFNHHMCAGFVGLKGALSGITISFAREILGSMAACPGMLMTDGDGQHVSLNLFGTYGRTIRKYPSLSEGLLQKYRDVVYQGSDYNRAEGYAGVHEKMCMCLSGFSGASITDAQLGELSAFSDGVVICGDEAGVIHPFEGDNVTLPDKFRSLPAGSDMAADEAVLKPVRAEIAKYIKSKKK
jgi:hypothetical protein